MQNINAVVRKLGPVSIRATNHRLQVAREEKRKREEMIEKQKAEAIAAKHRRNRGGISLSSKEEKNYHSDTVDDEDPDQAEGKYPVSRLDWSKATSD